MATGKPEPGFYLVGELRSLAPKTFRKRDGTEGSSVEAKVLTGDVMRSVEFTDEASARAALRGASPGADVSFRVVVLVRNGKGGSWLSLIGPRVADA
jgi:hypothetical protein